MKVDARRQNETWARAQKPSGLNTSQAGVTCTLELSADCSTSRPQWDLAPELAGLFASRA